VLLLVVTLGLVPSVLARRPLGEEL